MVGKCLSKAVRQELLIWERAVNKNKRLLFCWNSWVCRSSLKVYETPHTFCSCHDSLARPKNRKAAMSTVN